MNGHGHPTPDPGATAVRRRPPWEFTIMALLVALLCIGIIVAWTLVGSRSPERLDAASTATLQADCTDTQARLQALPNPFPRTGDDRVARIRAENDILRAMVTKFGEVEPTATTPAAALRAWSGDWTQVIDARARYADALAGVKGTDEQVQFVIPAERGLKPITKNMDDFVRENHPAIDACFTQALALDVVEGERTYGKVSE